MILSTSFTLLSLLAISASASPMPGDGDRKGWNPKNPHPEPVKEPVKKPTSSEKYGGLPHGWESASNHLIQDNKNGQRTLTGLFQGTVSLSFPASPFYSIDRSSFFDLFSSRKSSSSTLPPSASSTARR
jgi:hypothetical protein